MKNINISVYTYNELNQMAKKAAIQHHQYLLVDHYWWENVYEDFAYMASYFGITLKSDKAIYFQGLHGQGAGSGFAAQIDLLKMLSAIENKSWAADAPNEVFLFPAHDYDRRLIALVEKNLITIHAATEVSRSGNDINPLFEYTIEGSSLRSYPNIQQALIQLEEIFCADCKAINAWLFRNLERDYEDRTSISAIAEYITEHGYEFLQDGSPLPACMKQGHV